MNDIPIDITNESLEFCVTPKHLLQTKEPYNTRYRKNSEVTSESDFSDQKSDNNIENVSSPPINVVKKVPSKTNRTVRRKILEDLEDNSGTKDIKSELTVRPKRSTRLSSKSTSKSS